MLISNDLKILITRIFLIAWGAANIPLGIVTGLGYFHPENVPDMQMQTSLIYEHMLSAIYMSLGVCAILAAFNPVRHKLLILFIIISSYAHGSIMFYDGLTIHPELAPHSQLMIWDGLFPVGVLTLYVTATILLVFFPRNMVE